MKYIVKDTHIRHGSVTYGPGDVIELTKEEAAPIGHHLEIMVDVEEPAEDGEVIEDGKKRRRK